MKETALDQRRDAQARQAARDAGTEPLPTAEEELRAIRLLLEKLVNHLIPASPDSHDHPTSGD